MMKIKAVIIGASHAHINEIALYMSEQENFEFAAFSDISPETPETGDTRLTRSWNIENVRKNFCDNFYDDYKAMLDEVKPDFAFILCENYRKPTVVSECAKRGIDICLEKPVAVSLEEAVKIQKTVKEYGITAVVNWPVVWRPYIHKMMSAIEKRIVGEPIKLRYINGHTGPYGKGIFQRGIAKGGEEEAYNRMSDEQRGEIWWHKKKYGGGVFLDIAGYGCFYSDWIFGKGKSVMAYGANLNTPFGDTEDDCAAIIKYDGKMSVIEGTWITPRIVIPSGPMVVCTDGVITCTGGAEDEPDVVAYDSYGREVEIPEIKFEDKFKNMPCQWANYKKTGEPIFEMLTFDKNIEVMEMLDAVINSSSSGKAELL